MPYPTSATVRAVVKTFPGSWAPAQRSTGTAGAARWQR